MKIFREYVIVKVPSVFIEEAPIKGVNGKTIVINHTFNPERHVRNFGIVTSIPDELLRIPLASDHLGLPKHIDNPIFTFKTYEDIELEVEVGDKIYFHHNALLPDQADGPQWNKMHIKSEKIDGEVWHYFMVRYMAIYAAVRYEPLNRTAQPFDWKMEDKLKSMGNDELYSYTDLANFEHMYRKRVIMVGSYVFVEPDMETWEEISIPIPEVINGKRLLNADGSVRLKPKEQWLVRKVMPEERYLCGWVRYCGSPLKGDKEFLRPGMYVYFQKFANTKIRFEGKTYFRMLQRHIFGISYTKPIVQNETV